MSRKYPYPPQGRLMEIPRGRRVSKAQFFKGKYDTKMEFPEGSGGYGYFWNNTFSTHITGQGEQNKYIYIYVQERYQQCLCQKYILRNLNTCTCMDTKLSMVNYKSFVILSPFVMMTGKLLCTVQLLVVMNTGQ